MTVKVETGSDLIHRFDDVIDLDTCQKIYDYVLKSKGIDKPFKKGMPWHDNDSMAFSGWGDRELKNRIDIYRQLITQLVCICYSEIVFPHFTDAVLWRPGKYMELHKDNGNGSNIEREKVFKPRIYSSVVYINDNYIGGETFIRQQNKEDYISTPKAGSVIIFKSNEECMHGVKEIKSGLRVTLPIWFTNELEHAESYNGVIKWPLSSVG